MKLFLVIWALALQPDMRSCSTDRTENPWVAL